MRGLAFASCERVGSEEEEETSKYAGLACSSEDRAGKPTGREQPTSRINSSLIPTSPSLSEAIFSAAERAAAE